MVVTFVVITFAGRVLDRSVQPFNLTIGPRMVRLGQPMFNAVSLTNHVETHRPRIDCVSASWLVRELDAVIREDRGDAVRNDFEKKLEELPGCFSVRLLNQLHHGELAGSIDGDKKMKLAFLGSDLSNIDMEEANWVAFEPPPPRLVTAQFGQSRDTMLDLLRKSTGLSTHVMRPFVRMPKGFSNQGMNAACVDCRTH